MTRASSPECKSSRSVRSESISVISSPRDLDGPAITRALASSLTGVGLETGTSDDTLKLPSWCGAVAVRARFRCGAAEDTGAAVLRLLRGGQLVEICLFGAGGIDERPVD